MTTEPMHFLHVDLLPLCLRFSEAPDARPGGGRGGFTATPVFADVTCPACLNRLETGPR